MPVPSKSRTANLTFPLMSCHCLASQFHDMLGTLSPLARHKQPKMMHYQGFTRTARGDCGQSPVPVWLFGTHAARLGLGSIRTSSIGFGAHAETIFSNSRSEKSVIARARSPARGGACAPRNVCSPDFSIVRSG